MMNAINHVLVLDVLIAVILGLIAVICFQGSIEGSFVFDDVEAVINNKDVKLENPLFDAFVDDFWGTALTHNSSHKSYRPLTVLSFRLNVWLNGGRLNPKHFHALNIALHAVATALTYPLLTKLFRKQSNWDVKPIMASLLFAIHPVHTEAVAAVVGRADILCAIFSFSAIITYAHATSIENSSTVHYAALACCFTCIATLFKEQGITALGICSAYDVIVVNAINPVNILKGLIKLSKEMSIHKNGIVLFKKAGHRIFKKHHHLMLWRQFVILASASTIMYVRCWVMGFEMPTFQKIDNPASFAEGVLTRFVNYNYLYALNCWILLCPEWLCFDWSMGCVPLIKLNEMFRDPRLVAVILFWVIFGALVVVGLNSKLGVTSTNVLMALCSLIIPFIPASNAFFRVGFVVAERVLYIPSVGYCMLIAIGMEQLYLKTRKKSLFCIAMLILIVTNVSRCHQRSLDWRNERVLFLTGAVVCPLNAKVHHNLGKTSTNSTQAISHYREAVRLNSEYEQALNNLANLLRDKGEIQEAEALLRRALMIRPNFAAAWMNLGIVLSMMKRYDESLACYKTAITYRKKYPNCYYNLGNLFLAQQKYNEAYEAWKMATSQKPEHAIAWNNMIVMKDSLGELDEAERLAMEALSIIPDDSSLHFNLANTLGKKSQFEKAELHFNLAIKLKPNQALYHTNLGVLYHRWKKYKAASEQYLIALSLNPGLSTVDQNLKTVQKLALKADNNA